MNHPDIVPTADELAAELAELRTELGAEKRAASRTKARKTWRRAARSFGADKHARALVYRY